MRQWAYLLVSHIFRLSTDLHMSSEHYLDLQTIHMCLRVHNILGTLPRVHTQLRGEEKQNQK